MASFRLGERARQAGFRLQGFDTVGSTNTLAMEAARSGDSGRVWYAALQQTDGRGRRGTAWQSPPGNLAASVLLVSSHAPATSAGLGFVAGIALRQALTRLAPESGIRIGLDAAAGNASHPQTRFRLKWPNDVLADGAKLAGILLENEKLRDGQHALVIGFGANIVAAPEGVPYPATSLKQLGFPLQAEAVLEALGEAFAQVFDLWDDGRNMPAILAEWRHAAAGIGAPVAIKTNGEVLRGIFETIDETGRLIVRAENDRVVAISAGEVHFGATATHKQ